MKRLVKIAKQKEKDGVSSTLNLSSSNPEWRIGNMNNPATYIYCKFNSFQPLDEKEELFEKRNYMESMANYKFWMKIKEHYV